MTCRVIGDGLVGVGTSPALHSPLSTSPLPLTSPFSPLLPLSSLFLSQITSFCVFLVFGEHSSTPLLYFFLLPFVSHFPLSSQRLTFINFTYHIFIFHFFSSLPSLCFPSVSSFLISAFSPIPVFFFLRCPSYNCVLSNYSTHFFVSSLFPSFSSTSLHSLIFHLLLHIQLAIFPSSPSLFLAFPNLPFLSSFASSLSCNLFPFISPRFPRALPSLCSHPPLPPLPYSTITPHSNICLFCSLLPPF